MSSGKDGSTGSPATGTVLDPAATDVPYTLGGSGTISNTPGCPRRYRTAATSTGPGLEIADAGCAEPLADQVEHLNRFRLGGQLSRDRVDGIRELGRGKAAH